MVTAAASSSAASTVSLIKTSATLSWKDVVYAHPLVLRIEVHSNGSISDIRLSHEPVDPICHRELSNYRTFAHVFSAGEFITRITWFHGATYGSQRTRDIVGIKVCTNRNATLTVGTESANCKVVEPPAQTFPHTLTLLERWKWIDASVIVMTAPLSWLRSHPTFPIMDSTVVCGQTVGHTTTFVFHLQREEIASLVVEVERGTFKRLHVLDRWEFETLESLALLRNQHVLPLEDGEEITSVVLQKPQGSDVIVGVRVVTTRRQSLWFGSVKSDTTTEELVVPPSMRVCGFHGSSGAEGTTSLGFLMKETMRRR